MMTSVVQHELLLFSFGDIYKDDIFLKRLSTFNLPQNGLETFWLLLKISAILFANIEQEAMKKNMLLC
jgi:hypothetical protein